MARFRYAALTADGKSEAGQVEFASERQAYESLTGLGLIVIEMAEVQPDATPTRALPFALGLGRPLPLALQADVAEQMALMLGAKLPLPDMIRLLAEGAEAPRLRRHFTRVGALVSDGLAYPEAFARGADLFTPLFPALVAVSYAASDPAAVLTALARYLRRQDSLQAAAGAALVYPVILLMAALALVLLITYYLAPNLAPMFAALDRPVPGTIGFFLGLGAGLDRFGPLIALALALSVVTAYVLARRHQAALARGLTRLPLIGPVRRGLSLARLSRALALLLTAGIPLAAALRQTAGFLPNEAFAGAFVKAADALEKGQMAAPALAEDPKLPRNFAALFAYGEKANTLPHVIESLAAAYEARAERQAQALTQLLVPLLTLVIGGGIAALVYAVMGAVVSVNDLGAL